jgi:hypothetical protein
LFDKSRKEFKNRQAVMLGGFVFYYCCPVNNNSPLYCFVVQCFIAIFTKGACLYTMRAALGFAACQSKNAQQSHSPGQRPGY